MKQKIKLSKINSFLIGRTHMLDPKCYRLCSIQ